MLLTSIVIPVRGNLELTDACIRSIRKHTADYEIILIDNASDAVTHDYLDAWTETGEPIRVIRNALNLGWPIACNQGMATARGDFIVLLNNDTEVTAGWLPRLLAPFADPRVGLVGPMSDNVGSKTQNAGIRADWESAAERMADKKAGQSLEVSKLIGFCLAVRREVVDVIGGLDPRFGLGNFDDDDYGLRAQLSGFTLRVAQDCFVHHVGHQTFLSEGINVNHLIEVNLKLFLHKWRSLGVFGKNLAEMAANGLGNIEPVDLFIPLPSLNGPTISLCVIAKNEEAYIEDCLKSVAGAVDEICVVDTGSTDRTVEIARQYGAKIGYHEWDGDFSTARNASLALATCDWILVLDADERLKPESVNELRWLSHHPLEFGVVCQIESTQGAHKPLVSPVVRFFRNHIGVQYEGRLHEQPMVPGKATSLDMSGIRILHLGYEPNVIKARGKLSRNLAMALQMAQEAETFHSVFNLTRAYWELEDYAKAAQYAGQAKRMAEMPADVIHASVLEVAAVAAKDGEKALALSIELRERFPAVPRVVFMVGKLLAHLDRFDEAMVALDWRQSPDLKAYLSCNFSPPDLVSAGTSLREACDIYALSAAKTGKLGQAIGYLNDVIVVMPVPDADLYLKLVRLLMGVGQWQLAGETLNKALKIEPWNKAGWGLMAQVCEALGRDDLAAEARGNLAKLAA